MREALAAGAALAAFAAAWELAGALEGRVRGRLARLAGLGWRDRGAFGGLAARLRIAERIERAGLGGRLEPGAVFAAKLAGAVVGMLAAVIAAPVAPGRLAFGVGTLLVCSGAMLPDALLERAARRRSRELVAALPDALDLLAVAAASGRGVTTVLREISTRTEGPLATELAATVAEIECGASPRVAFEHLHRRVGVGAVASLSAALERSRSHGSPLAEQLHGQASALRGDARRRIEDRAARAAPKIQLVVALVLVPSVLLLILAAILAHSDALLGRLGTGPG